MKQLSKAASSRRRALLVSGLAAIGGAIYCRRILAGGDAMAPAHDHHHAPVPPDIKRSEALYKIPHTVLVRDDGASVNFPQELDDGHRVILDFVYTSCTTVCPVTSVVFSQLQALLGADLPNTKMVSISIDPDYDTPARLREYGEKFHAGPQWRHYTGTRQASLAMQKAFNVYRGDKMSHFPVTFLRAAPGKAWIRLEGFATPDVLAQEYRKLTRNA